jgi:hypothetical protein
VSTEVERIAASPDGEMVPVRPVTPLEAFLTMTQAGATADQLKMVGEVVRDWEANEARKAFAVAMNLCQQEMPVVLKDAENKHTKSRYARLESLTHTIKPVYTKHGFSLNFGTADTTLAQHIRLTCKVTHRGGHSETFQADIPLDGTGPKGEAIGGMNRTQAAGSTYSYGQRYLSKLIFNLTIAEEDDDAVGDHEGITEVHAAELQALVTAVGFTSEAFLRWAGVTKLREMTVKQYKAALVMLNDKKKRNGGGK